jgi:hypothetical protein
LALSPTPENFRVEIARYRLSKRELAEAIGMHPTLLARFLSGTKPLYRWAAHNIGTGINLLTGERVMNVDAELGLLPPPPRGRPRAYNQPDAIDPMRQRAG